MLSSSIQIAITYLVLVAVSALFAESSKALIGVVFSYRCRDVFCVRQRQASRD